MRFTKMLPLDQRKRKNELFKPQKVVKEKSLHIFFCSVSPTNRT